MNKVNFHMILLSMVPMIACTSSKQVISSKSQLDARLQNVLTYEKLTGFSVAAFSNDQILYSNAFGHSNIDSDEPYTLGSKQIVGSISKTVVAVALMKAQELGLFSLDDPITEHLPFTVTNPHFKTSPITIRHLATHTSSLKYSEQMTDERAFEHTHLGLKEFLGSFVSEGGRWYDPANFHKEKPGVLGDYSNVGVSLVALIIEYVSGTPFDEFAKEHIFEPLGMNQTNFQNASDVNYYTYDSKIGFEEVSRREGIGLYPSGRLCTNVLDLTKFCQMVMNYGQFRGIRVLDSISVKEMLHARKIKKSLDDEIHKQAIIWSTMKSPLGVPNEMIGHSGGDYGVFTMMFFNQKSGLGYILLSNTGMTPENHISMVNIYQSLWRFSKEYQLLH